MQQVETSRSSWLFAAANYLGWPLLTTYAFCMFAYPLYSVNWKHVQDIWDRWQTLNTGALAFLASLLAFNISRFNENRQREREFVAAKAFLPSTLSGLMEYCGQSGHVLRTMWDSTPVKDKSLKPPELPNDYREVFSNCIRHADSSVGTYLSNILVRLQVHEARLRDAIGEPIEGKERIVDKYNLLAYLLNVGEIYALVSNLFGFARGEEKFKTKPLSWDDFRTAYSFLNLQLDDFVISDAASLMTFTQRRLNKVDKLA